MYRMSLKLGSKDLPELQAWLDEHVPGWMHDTDGMSWREHWKRYDEIERLYGRERVGSAILIDRTILIPEDNKLAVLIALRWGGRRQGIRGRSTLRL